MRGTEIPQKYQGTSLHFALPEMYLLSAGACINVCYRAYKSWIALWIFCGKILGTSNIDNFFNYNPWQSELYGRNFMGRFGWKWHFCPSVYCIYIFLNTLIVVK